MFRQNVLTLYTDAKLVDRYYRIIAAYAYGILQVKWSITIFYVLLYQKTSN